MENESIDRQPFNFLNEVYDAIKCFENNPSKLSAKLNELKTKFEKARSILTNIPGIDMSQKEQEDYYISLLKQYEKENELLSSYKQLCKFDINKLDQPIPEDFKAARASKEASPEEKPSESTHIKASSSPSATNGTTNATIATTAAAAPPPPSTTTTTTNSDVMEYDLNRSDSIVELKDSIVN